MIKQELQMPQKIEQKIVGYKVVDKDSLTTEIPVPAQLMHELLPRPNCLTGTTYKVKTPQSEHALYITINDMVLDGIHHPYEMFINSKNMDHFQWVLALTRLVSAVWRKGGDSTFLVEELKNVFDPKGGYYKRGGVYMPSLVAEIGSVIEQHLIGTGVIKVEVDAHQQAYLEAKKEEVGEEGLKNAKLCTSCNTKSLVLMDGCVTCVSCGFSKCN
jgi:hypothetical protein